MSIPDVVGLQLGDARKILDAKEMTVDTITVTSPPREKSDDYDDSYRVIRTSEAVEKKIKLLVCKPL